MTSGAHASAHPSDAFGARLGMWLFLVTEILLFGGLFIAYSYMRSRYPHEFHAGGKELNVFLGVLNTAVLLTSSLTMALAVDRIHRSRVRAAAGFTGATVLLGLCFLGIKAVEWGQKFGHGLYPGGPALLALPPGEKVFFGLYFTMTGLHGIHVLAGVSVLTAMAVLLLRGSAAAARPTLLENGGLYWHLVDVVWIYLLPLFYLAA